MFYEQLINRSLKEITTGLRPGSGSEYRMASSGIEFCRQASFCNSQGNERLAHKGMRDSLKLTRE
jgi:hypothetical protein